MNHSDDSLVREARALLAYRERLAPPRRVFCDEDGSAYPSYHPDVVAFFAAAGGAFWSDHGYIPQQASRLLDDEAACARASLPELRAALTYCVRAERFGDGAWNALLTSGRVQRLLDRLEVLVDARAADEG